MSPAEHEEYVGAFRSAAGKQVRWTLRVAGRASTYEGRVPPVRRWRSPDEPCLTLRPGSTDAVHVLAELELRLFESEGQLFLARRKWYSDEDLDLIRLGAGPVEMELEILE